MARILRRNRHEIDYAGRPDAGRAGCPWPVLAQTAPRTLTMAGRARSRAAPDRVTLVGRRDQRGAHRRRGAGRQHRAHAVGVCRPEKAGGGGQGYADRQFLGLTLISDADNQPPRVTGYQVNNQVEVRLDDVAKLGAALDALVRAGANQMNGVAFSIQDSAPLLWPRAARRWPMPGPRPKPMPRRRA